MPELMPEQIAAAGPTSTEGTGPSCQLRPSRHLIAVGAFAACLTLMALLPSLSDPAWLGLLWPLTLVLSVPAWLNWRLSRGPQVFEVRREGLRLERHGCSALLPWPEVIGLRCAYLKAGRLIGRSIKLVRRDGKRVVIPSSVAGEHRAFFDALYLRLLEAQTTAHTAGPDGWTAYPDAPQALQNILQDLRTNGQDHTASLFRGGIRKPQSGQSGVSAAILGVVVTSLVAGLFGGKDVWLVALIAGPISAAILGLFWGLAQLQGFQLKPGSDWLLVHSQGMAMFGKTLTGEMNWAEVKAMTYPREGVLAVNTFDGATIPVPDTYDAPLAVIASLCRTHHKRAEVAEAGPNAGGRA